MILSGALEDSESLVMPRVPIVLFLGSLGIPRVPIFPFLQSLGISTFWESILRGLPSESLENPWRNVERD